MENEPEIPEWLRSRSKFEEIFNTVMDSHFPTFEYEPVVAENWQYLETVELPAAICLGFGVEPHGLAYNEQHGLMTSAKPQTDYGPALTPRQVFGIAMNHVEALSLPYHTLGTPPEIKLADFVNWWAGQGWSMPEFLLAMVDQPNAARSERENKLITSTPRKDLVRIMAKCLIQIRRIDDPSLTDPQIFEDPLFMKIIEVAPPTGPNSTKRWANAIQR